MYGNSNSCHSCGSFLMGAAAGMAAGAVMGMTMAPSSRICKRGQPPAQAGGWFQSIQPV